MVGKYITVKQVYKIEKFQKPKKKIKKNKVKLN